jgi:hypothetical protein
MNKMKTKIPNDCALLAVSALTRLRASGVPGRLLMLAHPDDGEGHCCVTFQTDAGLLVHDEAGTRDLAGLTLRSSALEVARAGFGTGVKAAYWYGGIARKIADTSKNRRLSPREYREVGTSFDLLMMWAEER